MGHKRHGKSFLSAIVFLGILGALVYFVGIPFFHRLKLGKEADLLLTKEEYSKAYEVTSADEKVPDILKSDLLQKIVSTAKNRWAERKLQLKELLLEKEIDHAKDINDTLQITYKGITIIIDQELKKIQRLMDGVENGSDINENEQQINEILGGNRTGNDKTEEAIAISYESAVGSMRHFYELALRNRDNKKVYGKHFVNALAYSLYINSNYRDELNREYFQTRKGLIEERKRTARKDLTEYINQEVKLHINTIKSNDLIVDDEGKSTIKDKTSFSKHMMFLTMIINFAKDQFPGAISEGLTAVYEQLLALQ